MKNKVYQFIIILIAFHMQLLIASTTVDILYDSPIDIYGFQFSFSGGSVVSAEGGAAEDSGFMISNSSSVVLGFSLTGSYISSGTGILTTLTIDGDIEESCLGDLILSGSNGSDLNENLVECFTIVVTSSGCTDISACNYNEESIDDDGSCEYPDCAGNCDGTALEDECGVCNGDGSSCNGQINSSAITYNTNVDIYGFQFRVDNVELVNVYGGSAENEGFTVSYSPTSGMVVGFSFSGSYIPAGSSVLVNVDYIGSLNSLCISNLILSGEGGSSLSADIVDCINIIYEECEDMDNDEICDYNDDCVGEYDECGICNGSGIADDACDCEGNVVDECGECNGPGAVYDCGCNSMPIGACDCDGNIEDCAGICGGEAVIDECGECNGEGIADDACDCEGNVVDECGECNGPGAVYDCGCNSMPIGACDCDGNIEDCAGICGGEAVIDECGECNGLGIADDACDCYGNIEDCAGVCGGNSLEDACGDCNGDGMACGSNGTIVISYEEIEFGTLAIYYDSDVSIAGYQFQVEGMLLHDAYGGETENVGFQMSNSSNAFVAFTLTGNNILAGSGTLLYLNYIATSYNGCITNTIFGNFSGEPMLVINDNCVELDYTEVLGCMDVDACNYNSQANTNDNSCYYSEEYYDCNGDCVAGYDCQDVCGGNIVVDDCGICGGDGFSCMDCEELSAFNCNSSPYCEWAYEMIQCSGLSQSECEDVNGCDWNEGGGGTTGGDGGGYPSDSPECEGGWGQTNEECLDIGCSFLAENECALSDECSWILSNEIIDCSILNQQECNSIEECDWNDGGGGTTGGDGGGYPSDSPECEGGEVVVDSSVCIDIGGCSDTSINCPDWQDDPGSYQFVSTLVAGVILLDGAQMSAPGDMLAAFDVNGNIRGIGVPINPPFGPYEGTMLYEMTMRSNNDGDLLTFMFYDASLDLMYNVLSDYTFVINDQLGDVFDPYVLDIGIYGCTYSIALNYNPYATIENDTCEFPPLGNLSFENFNYEDKTIEIHLNCQYAVSDFEFTINGLNSMSVVESVGEAFNAAFDINLNGNVIMGSATSEQYISEDAGHILTLTFDSYDTSICFDFSEIETYIGIVYEAILGECVVPGCNDELSCTFSNDTTDYDASCLYNDCAGVCGGVAENCPDWEDDPGAYEFSATITGIVLFDGVQMGDEGDILAAFDSAGNVRGVGVDIGPGLTFGPYVGTPVFEIQLRSNAAGDAISFGYYDASADEVLDVSESYDFVINDVIGNVITPFIFNITTTVDLSIDLIAGWNWISFNVVPEDASLGAVLASVSETAMFINSQSSGTATNYGEYGWYGGLTALDPADMYLLQMSEAATLTITGVPVNVSTTPIELIAGWNWIGYLPQNAGSLGDALASVSETAVFINSQSSGTSTNYGDYGWYGGLTTLEPGKGYLLDMSTSGTLVYPEFNGLARVENNTEAVQLSSTISDWDFNYGEYRYVGTVTTSIENRIDSEADLVGVFVGDECRGIAERMYFPFDDRYMYIVQVYSNVESGEELTFKYYDSVNDVVVTYEETLEFSNYMNVGDGFNTYALTSEIRTGVYTLTDAYPNPFNPTTAFSYVVGESGMVNVSIYDITGRMVAELASGYQSAGTYDLVWNAGNASSGMYLIKMVVDNHTAMQKIMLIK